MRLFSWLRLGCGVLAAGLLSSGASAATWFPLGPFGGSARSFAIDPADSRHIFVGTAIGWIYESHDEGQHWARLSQISNRNDLVIDHILADHNNPKRLMAAVYTVDHPDGGIYISEDYGKNWYSQAEMRGQSIRSLARSARNPTELVAGTLRGVYRSMDNGVHWVEISPEGSTEIKEVQSIAVDPVNPDVIYAGTWHLPWKTTDGGRTWANIKAGIIDDSDVFSIIVDPKDPGTVYASACSGIYKSSNAGELFHKVQGIPSSARRTRTLEQDPVNLDTVFAGTTEGLYRTLDAGAHWDRLTPGDVIVNDVYVNPQDTHHVLIATDRGGIYRSEDGGATFTASNDGFAARQVIAYAADPHREGTVYVGLVNDKTSGGVFQSNDGGVKWQQVSEGLGGRDVFSLLSLEDGTLLAGTGHGIFRLQGGNWQDSGALLGAPVRKTPEPKSREGVTLPAPTRLTTPGPARHQPSTAAKPGKKPVRSETGGKAPGLRRNASGPGRSKLASSKPAHPKSVAPRPAPPRSGTAVRSSRATIVSRPASRATSPSAFRSGSRTAAKRPTAAVSRPVSAGYLLRVSAPRPSRVWEGSSKAASHHAKPQPRHEDGHSVPRHAAVATPARTPHGLVRTAASAHRTREAAGQRNSHSGAVTSAAKAPRHQAPPPASAAEIPGRAAAEPSGSLDAVVYSLCREGDLLVAGTSSGLLRSSDEGRHWTTAESLAMPEVHFVSALKGGQTGNQPGVTAPAGSGPMLLAAGLQRLSLSHDGGVTWDTVALPAELTQIGAVAIDGEQNLWVGGREGVWVSSDFGATWKTLRNLFLTQVDSLFYDAPGKRLLVTASNSPVVFSVTMGEHKVTYTDTGWKLRFARPVGDHLIGATLFDGMVLQPKMVESPENTTPAPAR